MARSVLLVGLAVLCCDTPGLAQDRTTLIEHGTQRCFTHGCYGCHRVGKVGTPLGPDLSPVGAASSFPYLAGGLRDPAAPQRPAHMPTIERTEAELPSLAASLASLR